MNKILLGSSVLLFTLTFNACVKTNTTVNSNPPISQRTTTPIIYEPVLNHESVLNHQQPTPPAYQIPPEVSIPTPSTSVVAPSTAGKTHQLKTIQGSFLTIEERSNGFVFPQYQDKLVLLQIFGKDCSYCFKEMPTINRIKRKYAGNLQIIAIQAQDSMSQQTASRILREYQMDYPVVDKGEALDLLHFIQINYEWRGILPFMLLLKNGVTEFPFSGETSYQEIDEAVQSLI